MMNSLGDDGNKNKYGRMNLSPMGKGSDSLLQIENLNPCHVKSKLEE